MEQRYQQIATARLHSDGDLIHAVMDDKDDSSYAYAGSGGGDGNYAGLLGDGGDDEAVALTDRTRSGEEDKGDGLGGRRQGLSTGKTFLLTTWWFAYNLYFFTLMIVTIPSEVRDIMGDEHKGEGMFVLFIIAGTVNLVASVILGYVTDRTYSPFGRRYSWLVSSSTLLIPFTMLLPTASTIEMYTVFYSVVTILSVAASIPYNGLFADLISSDQRGRASAILGAMAQIGNLAGAILGAFYTSLGSFGTYGVLSALWLVCLSVTVITVKEPRFLRSDLERIKQTDAVERSKNLGSHHSANKLVYASQWVYATIFFPLFEPLIINVDFRWVFFSRFLMQLGQYTIQEFLQYLLDDCIDLPYYSDGTQMTAETGVSVLFLPLLVFATISSVGGGMLSDKWGNRRKILMYISGLLMVFCCIMFSLVRSFPIAVVLATVFGVGYGAFLSVDFAIVMDVLPSEDDVARDIALWHLALVIPQISATPLAGLLLDHFQEVGNDSGIQCLGYTVIFGLAAVYIILGTFFISRIKKIK